ncbi:MULTISPECIES: stalk domain-containing protein [unclassified Paenibacillus]|uniref:stalk domain-containing protein n=1 Tax=unclassified Paenibacillus TaxID=185978 RepID=UPI001AE68DB6|nr:MULTISPECIES: stalk domain-containing protein [unclassified Paenibacillus]MBP1155723.1 hypothetical protein [Paenibacillus sp. PvP091]MBP1168891.1 hypothetical protein [Paenibacillus sp. PvR098]MBP2439919.1 hypothetical protein [Paenibacillus sp. PvP052]
MQPLRQLLLTLTTVFSLGAVSGQAAAGPEVSHLILYPGNTVVYINGSKTQTQVTTLEQNGRYYLPAAELNGWLGIPVKWDGEKQAVQITTPKAFLEYSLADQTVLENGASRKWGTDAVLQGDRLYIELTSLQQYISFHAKVDQELKRVELRYVKPAANRTLFTNDAAPNVKPVAKFTVDKESYRIGEPIHYSNLSYDPKGTKLTDIQWIGNAHAIFTPGLYKVSLTVTDSLGQYQHYIFPQYSRKGQALLRQI